ncbi:ATP-grasp domain-containing protein [Brevibacterium yomogidense]|uniref:ATP-grasp domain-containing protein n=1 Tax=Brevibacterium yomogidense TaxID=946573 RepID=UPI001177AE8B|nr:ATP-grasp domain-containing protein [Brevibacterium yomogidense]
MKKVLILGALAGQVDAVESLRRRKVEVHVCAHEPTGPGVEAADRFHLADIRDTDQVLRLAEKIGADVVYSVGSDIAMPTVAEVSDKLGLPFFHSEALTDTLRRKQALRERLNDAGLSPVAHTTVGAGEPVPEWDVFPSIVKPVDAQGQRGISVVHTTNELADAVEVARDSSISGPVIIEEFLQGPEVSAHVIVENGRVKFFLPSDRHVWQGPLVGVPEAHSVPLGDTTRVWELQLRELVEGVVATLGVNDGPLYFQTIFTSNGPRIIEVASRLDGCHLWRLIKASTGIDILDAVLGRLLGDPWPEFPDELRPAAMTLGFFLDSPDITVTDEYVRLVSRADAEFAQIQVPIGESPRRTNELVARVGYHVYPGV